MLDNPFLITFAIVLPALFVAAAWPLICLPRARALLDGVAGSACIAAGATMVGLSVGGVVPLPELALEAAAQEAPPAEKSADDGDAKAETAETSAATEEAKSASSTLPAASEPEIGAAVADTVIVPPGRPEWVNAEPKLSGKVHTVAVASGPYKREGDSRRALDEELVKATHEYIAEQLGRDLATKFIRYDAKTIKRRFVKSDNLYHDEATYSDPIGPMHEYFALLEFDADFRRELDQKWNNVRATSRLTQTGLFAGAALLFLTSIFGYFRLDNATRGYYTGRLQFMTAAAILAIVGAGIFVARWIHWM
jgi:hypothetical protein